MLGHKVSRERIGTELDGMIKGPDPIMALDLLKTMGLFEAVFEVHPSAHEDVPAAFAAAGSTLGKAACDMLEDWKDTFEGHGGVDIGSADARRQTILGALLLPLRHARVPFNKNKTQSMSAHIVRDSLKWKSKDAETIDLMHDVAPELVSIYAALCTKREDAALKIALGRCVKRLRHMWPCGVFVSCLLCRDEAKPIGLPEAVEEVVSWEGEEAEGVGVGAAIGGIASAGGMAELQGDIHMCQALEGAVRRFGVGTCWQWKPLLNGKEVMSALDIKGGPVLGVAMDACFDYQLVNPDCGKEELLEWLRGNFEAIQAGTFAW
jgi:hypothetical protein